MRLYLILMMLYCIDSPGQTSYSKLFSVQTTAEIVSADVLGNIYIVQGSEIVKYADNGSVCCTFSKREYGAITSVDTRDPLRIIVFYKPFGIVLLLDNKLTEQSSINLNTLDITDPWVVCSSEMQGIWVYDNANARLHKFNSQLLPVSQGNDLRQDLTENIFPIEMAESDYWLIILDKKKLLVFDKMGNYYKSLIPENTESGQLMNDDWFYSYNKKLFRMNIRTGLVTEVALPFPADNSKIVLVPKRMIRFNDNLLEVYSY